MKYIIAVILFFNSGYFFGQSDYKYYSSISGGNYKDFCSLKLMNDNKYIYNVYSCGFWEEIKGIWEISNDTILLIDTLKFEEDFYTLDTLPNDTNLDIYLIFNNQDGKPIPKIKVTYSYLLGSLKSTLFSDRNGIIIIPRKDLITMEAEVANTVLDHKLFFSIELENSNISYGWTQHSSDVPQTIKMIIKEVLKKIIIARKIRYIMSEDRLIYIRQSNTGELKLYKYQCGDLFRK